MRARVVVAVVAIVLLAAACSNAGSSKASSDTTPGTGPATTSSAADLTKNVPVNAPGVTDKEIDVATIVTKTNNPTGGSYADLVNGIKAYFDMVNQGGGIYGRKLVVKYDHDDAFASNQQVVQQSLSQDKAFATFGATSLFTGVNLLARAKQPTFIWNINPEFAGHPTIFSTVPAICFTCAGHSLPYIAKQLGATKVGILAYGIAAQSKDCAVGVKNSFTKYPTAQVAYFDDSLAYAQPLPAQVTAMKQKGVTLVLTCFDLQESFTLGKEMQKQGMQAVQQLPNGYDADFVAKNAALLEGDFVTLQFVALQQQPQIPEIQKLYKYTGELNYPVKELTVYGWMLAEELYTGLAAAGPNFSQAGVVDALNGMKAWTDHGLNPPIDWTKGHIDPEKHPEAQGDLDCFSAVRVQNGKFVAYKVTDDKQFICFNRNDPTVNNPQFTSFVPPGG